MSDFPHVENLGAQDLSKRALPLENMAYPWFLPKMFIFAEKGPDRALCTPAQMKLIFGDRTFDSDDIFYNHQTRFVERLGTTTLIERIKPEDVIKKANFVIYLEIVKDMIPNYKRNSSGDYIIDTATGEYLKDTDTPEILGCRYRFIRLVKDSDTELGLLPTKTGLMTGVDDSGAATTSTMYPMLEGVAKHAGGYYNNVGMSIKSLYGDDVDSGVIRETNTLPYELMLFTRADKKSSPQITRSLFGEPSVMMSLGNKVKNPATKTRMDFEYVLANNWYDNKTSFDDFEGIKLYRDNLVSVSKMILENEKVHVNSDTVTFDDGTMGSTMDWFDFDEDIDNQHLLINLFSGKSTKNKHYFTYIKDTETPVDPGMTEINISPETPVFMDGGDDGTLSNEEYEKGVVNILDEYADKNGRFFDTAINIESFVIDSGFTLETSEKLINVVMQRKDTGVLLSTHDSAMGEKDLPLSAARAVAVGLKTATNFAPESTFYNTSCGRVSIVAGTGRLKDGSTMDRIPLTYSIAKKLQKLAGGANQKMDPEEIFDIAPGNHIEELTDITPGFIPFGVKNTLWNDGMIWPQPFDRETYHFPQMQTVYDNPTSVMNNVFTMMAMTICSKIGEDAWRAFTNSVRYTDSQFIEKVTGYLNKRLNDVFAGLYVAIPKVWIDEKDKIKGYSWHMAIELYGNTAKSKAVYNSRIYRMSDLEA